MVKILGREVVIHEGLAKIIAPNPELYKRPNGKLEPAWMPVFYNPEAVVSRDFTVLFLKSVFRDKDFFFVDALAGTGVRGIRIGLEVGGYGILNDVDARAAYYIRKNIELNRLGERLEAYNSEANTLLNNLALSGAYVDYVDIDPYGSPSPFLDSAFKPMGKEAFLGVTATDIASLSCTHPHKAASRYWNKCVKVDFEKEYAIRLLVANTVLRASALEIELHPVISIAHKHYVRVFFRAHRGAGGAYRVVSRCIGYLWYCSDTLERGLAEDPFEVSDLRCSSGSRPLLLGPTWICNVQDPDATKHLLKNIDKTPWLVEETVRIVKLLSQEADIEQPYYRLDKLCSAIGINMPKLSSLLEVLKSKGIKCSRTHMDSRGIRVATSYAELVEAIKHAVRHAS